MWEIKTHSDTQVTKSISNWHLISNLLDPMFSQSCEGTTKDTGNEGQAEAWRTVAKEDIRQMLYHVGRNK